ncbi:winged helix-turn-helix domain-containing protein [Yinghuangia seranimata]|uniref:winged helix-turn-helix domain-containing protein n=1 Tax=Yinghuangia seranimata TaxID=408067 RepID=UPI00248B10B9|nr:winged helix-turn-helix domain-containing protein [Yinghuangia seranimata]MDI2127802.1 winged helix-turn-helix domain-containing protein [Yinghuangia seranimata]
MAQGEGLAAYKKVANELRARIAREQYGPGDRLPSLKDLQAEFAASNTVIKAALTILRNENLIEGQQGKGVYVRSDVTPGSVPQPVDVAALIAQVAQLRDQVANLSERLSILEHAGPGR